MHGVTRQVPQRRPHAPGNESSQSWLYRRAAHGRSWRSKVTGESVGVRKEPRGVPVPEGRHRSRASWGDRLYLAS